MKNRLKKIQEGQALLIILLVLAVSLTVVLSTVSTSVTDITISTREEDALRAFSAAEAGIEESLFSGLSASETLTNETNFQTSFTVSQAGTQYSYPSNLLSGESGTFWFVSHDSDGSLTCEGAGCLTATDIEICWGDSAVPVDNSSPAIELAVFYDSSQGGVTSGDFANVEVVREAFDGVGARRSGNSFSSASVGNCGIAGSDYQFTTGTVNLASLGVTCSNVAGCPLFAQVRMFYNETIEHPMAILVNATGGTNLPPQGVQIESTGSSGESTRRINVYRSYSEPPSALSAGVFSLQDLIK